MELYKKHWVVVEYCPGTQGFCDEIVDKYEFEDENMARKFMAKKKEAARESWLSYVIKEKFVPYIP